MVSSSHPHSAACPETAVGDHTKESGDHTKESCGTPACASFLGAITDDSLKDWLGGTLACAKEPGMEEVSKSAVHLNYVTLAGLASSCGLPADTLKLTAPPLTSCQGAMAKISKIG